MKKDNWKWLRRCAAYCTLIDFLETLVLALIITLFLLFLTSCATPTVQSIPIAVQCKTISPIAPALQYNPPYLKLFDAVRDLLGDREQSTAYEIELQAALSSCQ